MEEEKTVTVVLGVDALAAIAALLMLNRRDPFTNRMLALYKENPEALPAPDRMMAKGMAEAESIIGKAREEMKELYSEHLRQVSRKESEK